MMNRKPPPQLLPFVQHSAFSIHYSACSISSDPSRDGRHDADLVAGLHRRFQVLQKTDVFVVEVDVHEAVELVLAFEKAGLDAGGVRLEAVEDLADADAFGLHDVLAVGVAAERGGDADSNTHVIFLFWFSLAQKTPHPCRLSRSTGRGSMRSGRLSPGRTG